MCHTSLSQQTKTLRPVFHADKVLTEMGKYPAKKVCTNVMMQTMVEARQSLPFCIQAVVVGLPAIESSYTNHTTRFAHGNGRRHYEARLMAQQILSMPEGFLWVCLASNAIELRVTETTIFSATDPRIWSCLWCIHII